MKNALFFLAAILLLTVSCTDNQIQLNGDEPVSYTHLDVYKRQFLYIRHTGGK